MTKVEIMKLAHSIAKQLVGDYAARMVIALRQAWAVSKERKEMKLSLRVIDAPSNSKLAKPPFAAVYKDGVKLPTNPRGLWGKSGGVIEIQPGEVWEIEMGATFRVGRRTEKSSERITITAGTHQLVHDQSQHFVLEVTEIA